MKLEIFLALKYLKSRRKKEGFVSLISAITITCVAIGVMVLVVVVSVMNGFQKDIKTKILAKDAHINLWGRIRHYNELSKKILTQEPYISVIPFVEGEALIKKFGASKLKGSIIRGVPNKIYISDSDFAKTFRIKTNGVLGSGRGFFDLDKRDGIPGIVVGSVIADQLFLDIGDYVEVFTAEVIKDPFNTKTGKIYRVNGIFEPGFNEQNIYTCYVSLKEGQELFGFYNSVGGIAIKIKDPTSYNVMYYSYQLEKEYVGNPYYNVSYVENWKNGRKRNLFISINFEKVILAVILFFIILVAALNIASTLIMVVMEKKREIGILKAMGMKENSIKNIFIINGLFVGISGTLIGLASGLFITSTIDGVLHFLQDLVNFIRFRFYDVSVFLFGGGIMQKPMYFEFLPGDVYYITTFPVDVRFSDIFIISLISILISTLFSFLPAYYAAKMNPVEAIHNE